MIEYYVKIKMKYGFNISYFLDKIPFKGTQDILPQIWSKIE